MAAHNITRVDADEEIKLKLLMVVRDGWRRALYLSGCSCSFVTTLPVMLRQRVMTMLVGTA